ncbi:PQQ-binding-like beta-propeller repeat protein, partial [Xanthovirga aplysinae]|uniref:PQQ-binding-like beta-propeller repeat protein n=1 Tax=Xanthovirga aplysinae TaxID=2529853 RepID=UPI0012BCBB28
HGDKIFFNSGDGNIYALDKNNGELVWKFTTNGEKKADFWDFFLSSPIVHNNLLIVGSGDHHIYALKADSGEMVWAYKTEGVVHAAPIVNEDILYIGSYDGIFYALNYATGTLIWKFDTMGSRVFPEGAIQRAASIYKDAVIFNSQDHNLYALNKKTGKGLWNRRETGGYIVTKPLVYKDNLYMGSSDSHRFYCLQGSNGKKNWLIKNNMRVFGTAVNQGNTIYYGSFDGTLIGVNATKGNVVFFFQTKESKAKYHTIFKPNGKFRDDFKLYGTLENELKTEKAIQSLGSILSTPVIENDIIYFGDANGHFYAVDLKESM